MPIRVINTGTTANSGNGDSIRAAFGKVNQNFEELSLLIGSTGTTFLELVEDAAAELFVHDGHSGFYVVYDDENNRLEFSVQPGPSGPRGEQGLEGAPGVDGSSVVAALSPPMTPKAGDLWYDAATGRMYVYYDAGWVDSSPATHTPPDDTIYELGDISGTVTLNRELGSVQICTLADDTTIASVDGMPSGRNFTLIIKQDSVGGRRLTAPSDWLFAGGAKYLSTTPNSVDMLNMVRVGTSTYAVLTIGYTT